MDPRLIYRINHQWIGYKDIVGSFKKHFVETGEMREDQEDALFDTSDEKKTIPEYMFNRLLLFCCPWFSLFVVSMGACASIVLIVWDYVTEHLTAAERAHINRIEQKREEVRKSEFLQSRQERV